jgi:hypothetical protein
MASGRLGRRAENPLAEPVEFTEEIDPHQHSERTSSATFIGRSSVWKLDTQPDNTMRRFIPNGDGCTCS